MHLWMETALVIVVGYFSFKFRIKYNFIIGKVKILPFSKILGFLFSNASLIPDLL